MSGAFTNVGRNPDVLITLINKQLNTAPPQVETKFDKVAFVDSTTMSQIAKYPMKVATAKEVAKGPTERRDFNDAEIVSFECTAERIEAPGEMIPLGPIYDAYGLLEGFASDLLNQALKIWDRRLATVINTNGTSYDGLSFFNTAHLVNPGDKKKVTFSNDINAAPDEAGFLAAWNTMQQIPGYDGTLMNVDMGRPVVLVPSMTMKIAFDKLLNEGLVARQVAGAAASENTRLVDAAEVVLMPELFNPADAASSRRWYMINRQHNSRRAFIVRNPVKPQFKITGPSDSYAHSNDARVLYYVTYGGAGYAMPQLALRCTF